jgi:hypothetical protein
MIMTNPQKGCQLPGILLHKVRHCGGYGWIAVREVQIAMEKDL